MSRRVRFAMMASALAFAVVGSAARADLINNGSFETTNPVVPNGSLISVPAGSNAIQAWTVTGTDVLVINTTYPEGALTFNAYDGKNAVDITGTANSGVNAISQAFATVAGTQYTLKFALGNAFDAAQAHFQGTAVVNVTVDGNAPVSFSNSTHTQGQISWAVETLQFTATSASTTVTFTNATAANTWYAGIDAVTIVPEPGMMTLAGAGLPLFLGLTWLRRRLSR